MTVFRVNDIGHKFLSSLGWLFSGEHHRVYGILLLVSNLRGLRVAVIHALEVLQNHVDLCEQFTQLLLLREVEHVPAALPLNESLVLDDPAMASVSLRSFAPGAPYSGLS